jgi:benzoyl-CoA reductase/2-hydroxyglutaryl-CoA dehydratase subunit BcrC/BadD/HgdB
MSDNVSHKESERLFSIIEERYGDRLTKEQLNEVRIGVNRLTEAAKALREIRLENWDEPFSIFRPYKGEE